MYKLTEKQILNCFIHLFMTLSVKNSDSTFIIIQIITTVYVVNRLKAEILLRINILIRKRIQLNLKYHALFIHSKTA